MAKAEKNRSKSEWLAKLVLFTLGLTILSCIVGLLGFPVWLTGALFGLFGAFVAEKLKLFEFSEEGKFFTSTSNREPWPMTC